MRTPGPPALPLLGNAIPFLSDKLGFLSRCAEKYGEVVRLDLGGPTFLLTNPADIRHVLVSGSDNYGKTPRIIAGEGKDFFGTGVVTTTGADHIEQRRLLHPTFHTDVVGHFESCIVSDVSRMLDTWTPGSTIDVNAEMLRVTQKIITRVLFGDDSPSENDRFEKAIAIRRSYQEYLLGTVGFLAGDFPGRRRTEHARANREIDRITADALRIRRARSGNPTDMLGMLARATYDDGSSMSEQQIHDEVRTIAVGGYETLAETLTWVWHLLAKSPQVESAFLEEIAGLPLDRALRVADCRELPYTRMVLAEAMRLYPAAWLIVRIAHADDILPSGAHVPAGTKIYLSQWVSHRNPRYFPDAERFDPLRFTEDAIKARPRLAYFPFGAGRRQCIGENLAWMEGMLIMAMIGRRFDLRLLPGSRVRTEPNVTLRPKGGLEMQVAARS